MILECDAVLFDLDGVLVDSAAAVERNWRVWADEHGLDSQAVIRVAHGQKTIDTMRIFAPYLDVQEEARRFAEKETAEMDGVMRVPGAAEILERLPANAWAVVTSGDKALALARMNHVGLPLPTVLVTADGVVHGKPAPDPYLLAAGRLGVPPGKCVVVEDSPPGIESGLAAGMRVIGLMTTHVRADLAGSVAIVEGLEFVRVATHRGPKGPILIEID